MTDRPPRSPRMLLITTVILTVTGMVLLALPHSPSAPAFSNSSTAPVTTSTASPPPSPLSADRTSEGGGPVAATAAAVATELATAPPLPPHGEGAAGDRAIQQALETAWPADLARSEERQLLAAGRALLRADATGIGRAQWPEVFGDPGQAIVPAYSRFRIQASIARRDGADDRAVVHLVWAGADRGGTYTDRRITDLHFTRTSSKKGASTWTAQPRI
ncbi:hypothetical protein AB0L85_30815 [Streptomyces sp. NPDC052051]|uniref:hypothetical protein n=1 Tax=Streptomyces sp. NPDC052051 TaxID=3154649 RepID=UPI00342495BC